jgi:hypothetical protein
LTLVFRIPQERQATARESMLIVPDLHGAPDSHSDNRQRKYSQRMFEDITPESHHARESYATYGLAMYKAQVMEAAVKQALIVAQVGDRKFQTPADYDAAFERHFRTVLGR